MVARHRSTSSRTSPTSDQGCSVATVAAGFEPVRDVLLDVVREQAGRGAAAAAWYDGRWVVDVVGGDWSADSVVMPYSVSKPFAALPALMLVDRGLLDLDSPLRRWWPELVADATLRQVLSHQSGIVGLDEPSATETFYDWSRACGLLAAQQSLWDPGSAHGECALFYGHLVGQPVRRVDGRSVGTFLREEITRPLGIRFGFGLSATEQRHVVDVHGVEAFADSLAGSSELYRRAMGNPPGALDS